MKLSGMLWWVGAFVLAALAGLLTYGLLSSEVPLAADAIREADTRPVVVAAVDIPFRRSIGEAELVIRDFPLESVPEGAATSIDQVVGKMSSVDIFSNEPVIVQQLVTPDIVTREVALSIPDGKIVTTVPTNSQLISNRLVRPGDRIDLMATFKLEVQRAQGSGSIHESVSLLQNLEVHAIILPVTIEEDEAAATARNADGGVFRTADEQGQSILLAVDPQDALAIRHILDVKGAIDLALRAPNDESVIDTVAVDMFWLAEKYQIEQNRGGVQSSPYAPQN